MLEYFHTMSANFTAVFLVGIAVVVMLWASHFVRALSKNRSGVFRPIYLPYTLYTVFISLWILSNAYFQSDLLVTSSAQTTLVMALLANVFSGLAFALAYLFSCRLMSEREGLKLKRRQWLLFGVTCVVILVTNAIPEANITHVDVYDIGDFLIHFGPASGAFFGILLLLVVLTLVNFIRSSRSPQRLKKVKASYMVIGMVGFILSTFLAHFLIPVLFNDFSMAWVPPALSIIEAIMVGYALLHNRFYSSRYIVMVSVSFIANAALYVTPILFIGMQQFKQATLLIVAWTLLTGVFWPTSLALIRRAVNQLLYRKQGNPVESICNLIGEFRYSTDEAVVKLNHVLNAKDGRIQKVGNNAETNVFVSCFQGDRSVLVREELEYQIRHDKSDDCESLTSLAKEMGNTGTSLVLPITNEKSEVTHLYMVSKQNENELFSSEEIMGLQRLFDEANRFIITEDKIRKSQVLAGSIAHEIRNPLTKIKYHFERIDADMFNVESGSISPFASHDMKKIYQELAEGQKAVQLGTRFIDAILDELRGEGIKTEVFEHYSVEELTRQVLSDFSFYSDNYRGRIHLSVKNDFIFKGSDTLFSFMLFNLLKNAVHYFEAYPNSQVNIHFKKNGEYNELHIVDTGPGISVDHQAHIFDDFYSHGKEQGNGLGLSYCMRVMQSFDGNIICRSLPEKYTEFVLYFPSVNEQLYDEETKGIVSSYLEEKSIILVGDSHASHWLSSELRIMAKNVHIAADIEAGISHACQHPVDILVIDSALIIEGSNLLQALRAGDLGHDLQVTPIIRYSSEVTHEHHRILSSADLIQGEIEGINNRFALHRSLENLIDEGRFAKLGSLIGKRVLVVDDMQVNRLLVQAYLTSEGVIVNQAVSGEEAVTKVTAESFDLVLMDIHMPGMGGIEAAQQIRALSDTTIIVALSGEYSEDTRSSIESAMHDHLVKPTTKQQLIKTLTKWLATKKHLVDDAQRQA
ncbi:ATP-binding response regulator [Enterovibrio calviensis]|uniref:ATP-binding response regulator n=1 Tax=Enterovibrio calviensis TaxID=91359 RepID=UPI00048697CD|nr:response regulator [Enterovibrio calviensis]